MRRTNFVVVVVAGVLALALTPGSADATIPTSERDALIDFYISTTGAGWTHRENWRNVGDTDFEAVGTECTWYGVTCDETEDHVTRISLNSNNLNGPISGSIGNFSALVILELLGNSNLTGPIPASIGNLAALQTFNAYDGSLSGSIPPEIGNLINLEWLGLSANDLDGAIPSEIGNLLALNELELDDNNLSGEIPSEIGNLANLIYLRAVGNQLDGSIPPEIGNLANLRYLYLSYNQLSGSIPTEIGDLTSLVSLDLSENSLTGPIPSEIGDLAALWSLILSNNSLTGEVPSQVGDMSNLRSLFLGGNALSGSIPPEIGDLEELRNLRIQGNVLGGPIPDEIVKLASLSDGSGLNLGFNALYTLSHAVGAFLDLKHSSSGDWIATQTVAPTEVSIGSVTNTTVELTWTPIDYTADTGGYSAWYATASGGPYTQFGGTADKNASSITVLGLNPVTPYYFHVDTVTDPHGSNQNTVISQPSPEVATRTFSGGGPTLSIGDATVVEGDSGTVSAVFTVSLYPPSMGPVSVTVATADTTASAGSDYVTASIPLVFAPGETSQTASITVNGDTLVEDDEYFVAFLQSGSGAGVGRNAGSAGIMNDDSGLLSHERQALIDLYNSTNGAGWTTRTNWRNAGDTDFNDLGTECSWFGNTCDATEQRVTVIRLERNNLDGALPDSIGDFTALEFLMLGGNRSLAGSIPPSIGRLAVLERLWAYDGSLSGPIPAEIGDLSYLENVWLRGNSLSGPIPAEFGNLSSLKYLDLEENSLSGSIPPQIGNLGSLLRLELGYNGLSGTIPVEIGSLTQLELLNLVMNSLEGLIPSEIGDLENLQNLYLFSNQLTGSIPSRIGALTQLRSLRLNDNQLSGSLPPELGDLQDLYRLELQENRLSGEIPIELGLLTNLSTLKLGENRLSGEIPQELGDLSSLAYLRIASNRLTGPLPAALADLTSLNNMTGLDLRWNGLHTDEVFLAAFLNTKHANLGDWRDTQTVAPENLIVTSMNDHTVWLSWDVVDYTEDEGGYEIFFAPTGSGSWVSGGWTSDKSVTLFPVTGLVPATIYDLAVVSYTAPHIDNQNWVTSDFSGTEMATTSDVGCSEPGIAIDFSAGISLSVPGSFSTYDWSTGESTAAIAVDPPEAQWYWVEVTSAGGCIDTAAKWVAPWVFANDFESGDLSGWSSATP